MPPGRADSLTAKEQRAVAIYLLVANGRQNDIAALQSTPPVAGSSDNKVVSAGEQEWRPQQSGFANAVVKPFAPVTEAILSSPAASDWPNWRRTRDGQGHSPLSQINAKNVSTLRLAWTIAMHDGISESTPLVYDGIMYLPNSGGIVQALDAATGDVIWEYRYRSPDYDSPPRNFVRIDMEGSAYTRRTLEFVHELQRVPGNEGCVGAVIQSYMRSAKEDVRSLLAHGIRIRLCKGAYKEPAEIAFQQKSEVDESYVELLKILLKSGVYHGLATHDEKIIQQAFIVYDTQKIPLVKWILSSRDFKSILVFCSKKHNVKQLTMELKRSRFSVKEIHSDLDQAGREQALLEFKSRRLPILVATDILSRGIDIDNIDLVINYDVPNDGEDYIHRIGRTARAETDGMAITFVSEKEQNKFRIIEELLGQPVEKATLPAQFGPAPEYNPRKSRSSGSGHSGRSGHSSHSGGGGRGGDAGGGRKNFSQQKKRRP